MWNFCEDYRYNDNHNVVIQTEDLSPAELSELQQSDWEPTGLNENNGEQTDAQVVSKYKVIFQRLLVGTWVNIL